MTVSLTLGLQWGLGNQNLILAKPRDHGFDMTEGILEGIDCELDVKLLPDPLIDSASMKNQGRYATLGCTPLSTVHLTAFSNH